MKRKVFSLMMLCLFAYLGMANAQVSPRDKGGITITPNPVEMGYRPNGAWMRPFEAQLTNSGAAETVTAIETTNEDFFIIDANLPAVVNSTKPLNFTIDNPDAPAGPYSAELVVWTNSRLAYTFNISATTYDPIEADVVETAPTATESFSATFGADIYDNYLLPGDEPDGKDVVYKLEVENDVLFNAQVAGANGKVALYLPDFNGQPGPGADNNYTGNAGGGGGGAPYEAQIGETDGTSTTGYSPFYTLYNYSISENLFHADELMEAGMTTAPMGSISYYATNQYGYEQKNISIWMANVSDEALTSTSHTVDGMTLVHQGDVTPVIGWNEFVFNQGTFAWDGSSNLLVLIQRNNGAWNSTINWRAQATGFNAMAYRYQDSGAYDVNVANSMYTSASRPIALFKSLGRNDRAVAANINDMTLTPGEYYLVASSTSDEFTLNVNMDVIPLPEPVANPFPADGDTEIGMPLTFTWELGQYTTEYRMICGTTYPPTDVVVDWTNNLAESLTVTNLFNNTNYFWRIDERNSSGEVIGPIWGFTTTFNKPQNVAGNPEKIYEGDVLHITWSGVVDRSYRGYNVYQDGVKLNDEVLTETQYDVEGLAYNMDGYIFNVTAVYDEGESLFSDDLVVLVTGNGTVSGKVTEQDGTTGIAGATVVFTGIDEFNAEAIFTFTTGANGNYSGNILAGTYTAAAWKEGYQPVEREEEVNITYNTNTPNIDFSLDENWLPVGEVIAEEVDENLVKVYWSQNIMSELIEDFETGDLSAFDWQNDATYPWTITNGGADSESQYCLKSGNAGVASSTSAIQVSVEISRNGLMSFYGKISCESSYDNGYFYIDGTQKASFTGSGNWTQKEFPITSGTHTFKWAYTKDGSVNSYDDCFYIDNISFIHDAAPAETGWITYEDGTNQDAIGLTAGGSFYWGICFPAEMMANYGSFTMTKVKMFDHEAHTGKVMIYKGGTTAPGTLVTEQNYTCTGSENYVEVTLSNPVSIDASQSIWVVLNNFDGQYVASCCSNTGDPNGRWISMDNVEWMDILEASASLDYTWQIQAYVTDGAKTTPLRKDVAAAPVYTPSNLQFGSASDLQGDPNWTKPANRAFKQYNIYRTACSDMTGEDAEFLGSTNDTIYLEENWANMEPGVYKWGVSRFYEGNRDRNRVTYDFEGSDLQGWTSIDNDGDGNGWANWNSDGTVAHSGTGVAASESYINNVGALTPDNWLVSPQVALGGTMTFWAAGQDPSWASEHFAVYVSTSGTAISNFTQVMNETVASGTMTQYTVNLSSYSGNGYVAIRHYNITDMFRLNIDDITLGAGGGDDPQPPTPPTPPVIPGGDMTYTGVHGESGVVWSNCIEHRMYVSPTINVTTNSGDAVTGTTVTLYNTSEPDLNLTYNVTLDETGTYTWESMRRGTYELNINLEGFTPIAETVEITDGTVLNYTLNEVIAEVGDLYVSGTGWAMFGQMPAPTPVDPVDPPTPPTEGQWYYYGDDVNSNNIGAGGAFYWAVMFPAGTYTGNQVTKVATWATGYEAFTGSVTIYNDGTTAPANAVGTMDVNVPMGPEMYEMEFPTPVTIDPSKNLWVVMYNATSTDYIAGACADAGTVNARWVSLDGTSWMDLATAGVPGCSWMLRAYIASGKGEVTEIAYEPQPCHNTGLVASGQGRSLQYYKVMLDGVLEGTTTHPFFQHDVENLVEGETYTTSVQKVYTTGESEWVSFDWVYTACDNFEGLKEDPTARREGDNVVLEWVLPESGDDPTPPDPQPTLTWDFESNLSGWTTIDADGDGYTWCDLNTLSNYTDYYDGMTLDWYHGGSNAAISGSYINGIGALSPDNYLVSPQVTIANGSKFSFWVAACDPSYASDHFGVFVSTTGTNPSDFTSVQEWTLTAKATSAEKSPASREGKGNRLGNWYHYEVDLSAYAGQAYIAFRHFNSYDWYIMTVDDAELSGSGEGPTPPDPEGGLTWDFESNLSGWTTIDADGDGYTWCDLNTLSNYTDYYDGMTLDWYHGGSNAAISGSYINGIGALSPDNYLVSPQVTIANGSKFSFWVAACDPSYASDHFGVFVSTTGTNPSDFTSVQEWTLTAKATSAEKSPASREGKGNRLGNWYHYEVDLSAYAGQAYIALRHFNSYDWYIMTIDDAALSNGKGTRDVTEGFESGIPSGWLTLDADGDGYTWCDLNTLSNYTDYYDGMSLDWYHSGSNAAISGSYINGIGALHPDNYLVMPQVQLQSNSVLSFWAGAADPSYASDHFGVFVSTTGTNPSDFTSVQEWTLTAKATTAEKSPASREGKGTRMGTWYNYTVDLSAYAGQNAYIAFRHFNSYDWYIMSIDDISLTAGSGGDDPIDPPTPGANVIGVEIFRDGEWIAEVKAPAQTYTDINPGEFDEYEIRVVYNGNTEDYTYYTMSCPEIAVVPEVVCIAPENLTGSYEYFNEDNFGALITWTYSEEVAGGWNYYDNGVNTDAIGTGGGQFYWAIMLPAGSYQGSTLTKVTAYDYRAMTGTLTIYNDGTNSPSNQVATMNIEFTGAGTDAEFVFDSPVILDPTKNVWVVFYNASGTDYPAACCNDETGDPNGRWVSIDGTSWMDLATAGVAGSCWMIRAYTSDMLFFNVYRNDELIAQLPYVDGELQTYYDQVEIGNYTYQVTALTADCESDPALTPDLSHDYVQVNVTDVNEVGSITKVYPNPTNGMVKIEAAGMTHITVVNALGQVLYDANINGDMTELNLGQYNAGIYMVRIAAESGVSVKRVTVVK